MVLTNEAVADYLAVVVPALSWGQAPRLPDAAAGSRSNDQERVLGSRPAVRGPEKHETQYSDEALSRLPEASDEPHRVRRIPNPVIDDGPPNPHRKAIMQRRMDEERRQAMQRGEALRLLRERQKG